MVQRQRQDRVALQPQVEDGVVAVVADVSLGEHDALGPAGRARREEDRAHVVGVPPMRELDLAAAGKHLGDVRHRQRIERAALAKRLGHVGVGARVDEKSAATALDELVQVRDGQVLVERDDDVIRDDRREEADDPLVAVLAEKSDLLVLVPVMQMRGERQDVAQELAAALLGTIVADAIDEGDAIGVALDPHLEHRPQIDRVDLPIQSLPVLSRQHAQTSRIPTQGRCARGASPLSQPTFFSR